MRRVPRTVDLISDALPFGRLWYGEPNAISSAIGYAKFFSRSHDAVIRRLRCDWQRISRLGAGQDSAEGLLAFWRPLTLTKFSDRPRSFGLR